MAEDFGSDPIQAHIDGIRALLIKRVYDPRVIQAHLTGIEVGLLRERQTYAAVDRPALPEQCKALATLAGDLGMRVTVPPKLSYGQAVLEGVRLNSLALRRLAQRHKAAWRETVAPIRGGVA